MTNRLVRRRRFLAALAVAACAAPSFVLADDRYDDTAALYAALREQPSEHLNVGGGDIELVFADGANGLDRARVRHWVETSAKAVATYFGRFPVAHVGLLVIAADGDGVLAGTTYDYPAPAIRLRVGRGAGDEAFRRDWILVHEMTHLALPMVPRRSNWLLEGSATYVEPIARAQAGQIDAAEVWRWTLRDMPKGLPQAGDRGLDHTPTWGRTYWGGAMFWLLADVRLRERTHGRLGVQDALRAINRQSGGNRARWSADQVMAAGDRATGTSILSTLYREMGGAPMPVDLDDLFAKLGVALRDGRVVFDEHAPLAAIRRRLTAPPDDAAPRTRGNLE